MCKRNICLRHKLLDFCRNLVYIPYLIIYIVNLSFSRKLPVYRFPDKLLIIFHNISLYRDPVHRWFLKNTHIPYSNKAHMESTRDRCSSQCKHIHIYLKLFYLLFVGNTKTLLLIYYQKPQILKHDIF